MESFLFVCILVVLVIRWIYLRNRLDALENRLFLLERAADRAPAQHVAAPPPIVQRPLLRHPHRQSWSVPRPRQRRPPPSASPRPHPGPGASHQRRMGSPHRRQLGQQNRRLRRRHRHRAPPQLRLHAARRRRTRRPQPRRQHRHARRRSRLRAPRKVPHLLLWINRRRMGRALYHRLRDVRHPRRQSPR